jgi:hypothetical protein
MGSTISTMCSTDIFVERVKWKILTGITDIIGRYLEVII